MCRAESVYVHTCVFPNVCVYVRVGGRSQVWTHDMEAIGNARTQLEQENNSLHATNRRLLQTVDSLAAKDKAREVAECALQLMNVQLREKDKERQRADGTLQLKNATLRENDVLLTTWPCWGSRP